jgi:hypothetical protein
MVKVGEIYEHQNGHRYKVVSVAKHSETLEDMVVYRPLYKSDVFPDVKLWVRPLALWESPRNGKPRFKLISDK